ncbi:hypothetical protein MTsPCn5_40570 [Croceitalea sp. MTPC5]|uniref:hypothetical protein n=1 Tax=Croceitalea sp. MTPC5 TaxID=3056565 RepID=UPI002B3BC7B0|nr:hypothetical protein MTsPCn5_40570 [Croceitalea sp. MTPC5]
MENINQFNELTERIESLEKDKKKKDIWDKISIFSSFLIPLSIFIAGYFLSETERKSKIAHENKEIQLAEIKAKVDQAQLVSTFLEALVDTNSYKRKLAIKSILLALSEKGEEIVMTVSNNDPDEEVKKYAKESLIDTKSNLRSKLIENIFSSNKQVRLQATQKLTTEWTKDKRLTTELISFANNRFGEEQYNKSGLINTIVVLNRIDISLIKENEKQVTEFLEKLKNLSDREQTQKHLEALIKRIN